MPALQTVRVSLLEIAVVRADHRFELAQIVVVLSEEVSAGEKLLRRQRSASPSEGGGRCIQAGAPGCSGCIIRERAVPAKHVAESMCQLEILEGIAACRVDMIDFHATRMRMTVPAT